MTVLFTFIEEDEDLFRFGFVAVVVIGYSDRLRRELGQRCSVTPLLRQYWH